MFTAIFDSLNEEKTIGQAVALAKRTPSVGKVIVVDDKSMYNTVGEARKAEPLVLGLGKTISGFISSISDCKMNHHFVMK